MIFASGGVKREPLCSTTVFIALHSSNFYTVQIDNSILAKVCDILLNGWRGSAVASCVNRHPWFLRGGFAVVLRVSLGRAVRLGGSVVVLSLRLGCSVVALRALYFYSVIPRRLLWSVVPLWSLSVVFSVITRLGDCSWVVLCLLFGSSMFSGCSETVQRSF